MFSDVHSAIDTILRKWMKTIGNVDSAELHGTESTKTKKAYIYTNETYFLEASLWVFFLG
jgi:hypothetical protein